MMRTYRGSCSRLAARLRGPAVAAVVCVALLFCTAGLAAGPAGADPGPDQLAALIANVAQSNQRLQDLQAAIETQQESVNKALVDVQTARDNATAAQRDV
ncbi:MAG TPA: peptidase M23, partial [Mycobacterium sp.]|nr:peptidase M23 [Mycobacterium sp.]